MFYILHSHPATAEKKKPKQKQKKKTKKEEKKNHPAVDRETKT